MTGDMVDSAMNYDFRRFCTQYFAENILTAPEFDLRLSSLLMRYKKQMLPAQLNLFLSIEDLIQAHTFTLTLLTKG